MMRNTAFAALLPLLALLGLSGCVTPSEREGDRLQSVGENTVADIDTTGLETLE